MDIVRQGPTALAVGAGGGCLDIFTLTYPFSTLSPSLWEKARYRLKYCLKGPLNLKKTTNQPTQAQKPQPEGKWIMPETRFTEFLALSVDPRIRIVQSAWRPMFDYCSYLRHQNHYILFVISFIFDILRPITIFSERHLMFFVVVHQ